MLPPVATVVERRHVWRKLLGNVDAVTWAIISGQMVYPRRGWMAQGSWLRNHPSWSEPRARLKLGFKFGQWLFQGALEWVPWWCNYPLFIEPMGAVPKKGGDEFRAIADARHGNRGLDQWGVHYFSVRDFIDLLDWCYLLFGTDWKDAYHLALMSGCTGDLVVGPGVVGIEYVCPDDDSGSESSGDGADEAEWIPRADHREASKAQKRKFHMRQRLVWGNRMHVGCTPETCLLTCDKAASGCATDGCVMRWAAAHFGQSPAGSGLNCMALCLLRHLARRDPHRGERRGASARTVLGAVWVDDFGLAQHVTRHPPCAGLQGGCPTCTAHVPAAHLNRDYWRELCRQLGIQFAEDKFQDVAQSLEYGGFTLNSHQGLIHMLLSKLEKLLQGIDAWMSASATSIRGIAEQRGRLIHYSLGVSHVRVLATELSWYIGTDDEPDYDRQVFITPDDSGNGNQGSLSQICPPRPPLMATGPLVAARCI